MCEGDRFYFETHQGWYIKMRSHLRPFLGVGLKVRRVHWNVMQSIAIITAMFSKMKIGNESRVFVLLFVQNLPSLPKN